MTTNAFLLLLLVDNLNQCLTETMLSVDLYRVNSGEVPLVDTERIEEKQLQVHGRLIQTGEEALKWTLNEPDANEKRQFSFSYSFSH